MLFFLHLHPDGSLNGQGVRVSMNACAWSEDVATIYRRAREIKMRNKYFALGDFLRFATFRFRSPALYSIICWERYTPLAPPIIQDQRFFH